MKKKTTELFIQEAIKIHGNKYDYSEVNYINANTKVTIICPEHGKFEQTPGSHLSGTGCPKCANNIKRTTELFIQEAIKMHGNKYDYSEVNYINNNTKVTIICPEHGKFEQTPGSHLSGSGCPKCANNIKRTAELFIQEAIKTHGNKYDYSEVNYINTNTKVTIICPEHGKFEQIPYIHLSGSGCPTCNRGYSKHQKFNLIKEFMDEYRLREFLMTNDINILHVIIQNLVEVHQIDSKYDPIIDEIINYTKESNPLKMLEEKYNEEFGQTYNESINLNDIDLDDDEMINNITDTISSNQQEYSIDEIIKAKEGQLKLIESYKNIISPEVIKYIEDKYLNDKLREWMSKRD